MFPNICQNKSAQLLIVFWTNSTCHTCPPWWQIIRDNCYNIVLGSGKFEYISSTHHVSNGNLLLWFQGFWALYASWRMLIRDLSQYNVNFLLWLCNPIWKRNHSLHCHSWFFVTTREAWFNFCRPIYVILCVWLFYLHRSICNTIASVDCGRQEKAMGLLEPDFEHGCEL